jgi:hypothetical protein
LKELGSLIDQKRTEQKQIMVRHLASFIRMMLGLGLLAIILLLTPQQTSAQTFESIDYPGAYWTETWGINNNGDLCGIYILQRNGAWHAWTRISGVFASFDVPGARSTTCFGLNDDGAITGNYWDFLGNGFGYRYMGGVVKTIMAPSTKLTSTHAIDNRGNLTGWYARPNQVFSGLYWSEGVLTTFHITGTKQTRPHGINNNNVIAGWVVDALGKFHGFTKTVKTNVIKYFDVPGASATLVMDINDLNMLTGWYEDNLRHAFSYFQGVYTKIDFPGSEWTNGHSISNSGQVVGMYIDSNNLGHGFVYTP